MCAAYKYTKDFFMKEEFIFLPHLSLKTYSSMTLENMKKNNNMGGKQSGSSSEQLQENTKTGSVIVNYERQREKEAASRTCQQM